MTEQNYSLTEALLETASDLHSIGLMDDAAYEKITLRHLGPKELSVAQPISGEEIADCAKKLT